MKTTIKRVLIPIIIIILLLLSAGPSLAQGDSPITASVDRTTLSTDETVTLTVAVNAEGLTAPRPQLPDLTGLNIFGTSSSSQISIVNGAMSAQVVYDYRLQPYQAGELVIEPVSVTIDGQTYTSQPITLQVTQGNGTVTTAPVPSSRQTAPTSTEFAGQKLFVEAEVDKPSPYLGEQVSYTFRLYKAADFFDLFDQPQYEGPTFTGFWSENQTEQSRFRVQAGGRLYEVTELRTVLFPTKAGEITIEPARLAIPGSFFRSGADLQTQPVTVDVQPLPANAPAGFSGAVGHFELSSRVDTTQSKVNEPLTWQVTLSGQGNLSTIADLEWPEMAAWRSFESQATTHTQIQDGQVVGSRAYERVLVPQAAGDFTIPTLEYSYFEPATGEYKVLNTDPIAVSIAPGNNVGAPTPPSLPEPAKENVEQVGTDIRHLKPVPTRLQHADGPLTGSPLYWLAWAVPLVGLVGNFVWQRRQQFWQNNAHLAQSSKARKKAGRALAHAQQQDHDVYEAAGQILTTYLADKLNQPVTGLTHRALAELLSEKGLQVDLVERVNTVLATAELGRYSPEATDPAHASTLLKELDHLITDLEKTI